LEGKIIALYKVWVPSLVLWAHIHQIQRGGQGGGGKELLRQKKKKKKKKKMRCPTVQ